MGDLSKVADPKPRDLKADRRSKRVIMGVKVVAKGIGEQNSFEEATETLVVSEHGCLLSLRAALVKGQQIWIANVRTKAEIQCAVVFLGKTNAAGKTEVGVEFTEASPRFWPVVFPPSDLDPNDRKRPLIRGRAPADNDPTIAK
jgi:PilZ domain